jgi:FKBP-type peptidyl-prolyl cis-trans isomerase SlyD
MAEALKVGDGVVVSMQYTLHVEGKLVDASSEAEPLQFIQGMGHIIPGLEHELYDMQIGESKTVRVSPVDGYGEVDTEAFMDVPREAFPDGVPLVPGTELQLQDKAGHPAYARIQSVSDQVLRLNMNHPLAGRTLDFEVTIAAVRAATEDEVAHGHVHTGDPSGG